MRFPALFLLGVFAILPPVTAGDTADRRLLELTVGKTKHQGRQYVSDAEICWLLERDGHLESIELKQVTEFKQVANTFRPFSAAELRSQLTTELGTGYEADIRGNHIAIAPTGQAKTCVEIVDKTSKSFSSYFSRRNFKLDKLEAPMITVVFRTHNEFLAYCDKGGIKQTKGLLGYYSPMTNRVALYLPQPAAAANTATGDVGPSLSELAIDSGSAPLDPLLRLTHSGAPPLGSGFADTLAHETTHQMGFNSGLHSRLGDDPKWVIEGMAMLFEGDANRDDARQKTNVAQRMNRDRFLWFQEYQQARRKPKSLEEFLTSDALFTTSTLDAYSEAWAFTFFLAETRASNLSGYLKKLANRTELGEYTPMKRLGDFKASFGKDLPNLEAHYLRFIQNLETASPAPATPKTPGQSPPPSSTPVTLR